MLARAHQCYIEHSYFSDPGMYVDVYKKLPSDIPSLVHLCQSWVCHYLDLVWLNNTARFVDRVDLQMRFIVDMLQSVKLQNNGSSQYKMVGVCWHIALFLCSILRSQGTPCRLRLGFSDYQSSGYCHDDVIVEVYSFDHNVWHRVDVRTTPKLIDYLGLSINFNLYDVPEPRFLPAYKVWQQMRAGKIDANLYGTSQFRGAWYIKNCMLRDLMYVLKVDLLLWDTFGLMHEDLQPEGSPEYEQQLCYLDKIANVFEQFELDQDLLTLLKFYHENKPIHISQKIITYGPVFPQGKLDELPKAALQNSLIFIDHKSNLK